MSSPVTINHEETGLSRLISQWTDKPVMRGLVQSFMQSVQGLEDDLMALLNERNIYDAIGEQLDVIGLIVGVERLGRTDEEYRNELLKQIAINNSDGSTENVISVMESITGTDSVSLWEHFPASYFLIIHGGYFSGIADTLDAVSSAGVKATLLFDEGDSLVPGELTFETTGFIDDEEEPIEVASGDETFTELWTDPATLVGAGWVDNGGGSYTHSGVASGEIRDSSGLLAEDSTYIVTVTAAGAGSFDIQLGGTPTNGYNTLTGLVAGTQTHLLIAEDVGTLNAVRFISDEDDITLSNIEVRLAVIDELEITTFLEGFVNQNSFLPELVETDTINPLCDLIEN